MTGDYTKIPISDRYILSKLNTNIVLYHKLAKYDNINNLFVSDSMILLYENTAGNVGHWVALVRQGEKISYFDSYVRPPDPYEYLKGKYPDLTRLLVSSPYIVEYNDIKYQAPNMATCGRYAIARVLSKKMPLSKFQSFLMRFQNPDDIVTALTYMI